VGKALYSDQALRSSVVAMAAESVKHPLPTADSQKTGEGQTVNLEKRIQDIDKTYKEISSLKLPLGWDKWWEQSKGKWESKPKSQIVIVKKFEFPWFWLSNSLPSFPGIVFTALMVSLGSNFWFELLNKLINMRNAGKKPLTKEEKAAQKK
jgi:hypothetical protein